MRKVNFGISQIIYVDYLGNKFDLHNDFVFQSFRYNVEICTLTLSWYSHSYKFANNMRSVIFELKFTNVEYLSVQPRDAELPLAEDETLEGMGYVIPEFLGRTDGYLDDEMARQQEMPFEEYHMIFRFQGGQAIVVRSDEVVARLLFDERKLE